MANRISPLILAAKRGLKDKVDKYLTSGKDVTASDLENKTILHYAAQHCWLDTVQLVVQKEKLSIDSKSISGRTPILLAAEYERKGVVDFLLNMGADVTACDDENRTILHHAAQHGWLDTVQLIVQMEKLSIDSKSISGCTPTLLAAEYRRKRVVDFFLKMGADITACEDDGFGLLHYASAHGWLYLVQHIIETDKLDINLKTSSGFCAVTLAATKCQKEMVDYLLKMGSNLTASDCDGMTLIHLASRNGWLDVVQFISKQGKAIVNITNKYDVTPLLMAARCNHIDIVNFLLQLGADHWCPISEKQFTKMSKHDELAKALAKDVNFCTFATIHIFNDKTLPSLYTMLDRTKELPSIDMLKVPHRSNESDLIREFVANEIRTNGKCNAMEVHPPVLKLMCVRSILSQCSL